MFELAPSLIAADFNHLKRELNILAEEGIRTVHLDIMDGRFVPNISIGMGLIKGIRSTSKALFDVHMMVADPEHLLSAVKESGADRITVHYEACSDIRRTVSMIQELGLEAGVAVRPETPVAVIDDELLKKINVVQIMSVTPGIPGQTFLGGSIERIRHLKSRIDSLNSKARIEVDGDVNSENLERVLLAGAEIIVIGTAMFRGDIRENIRTFREIFKHARREALEEV